MSPQRIQRRRTKGWRMPEGAVYVGRPTAFGNPYCVAQIDGQWIVLDDNDVDYQPWANTKESARRRAVELFADIEVGIGLLSDRGADLATLAGHDLACWCPLDQPCHADVLLEIANRPEPQGNSKLAPTCSKSGSSEPRYMETLDEVERGGH